MSNQATFKKIKQKTYLFYHQDGLIDIVIGLCILGLGISAALESESFILGFIPALFLTPLKNRITVPRLGFVQLTPPMDESKMLPRIIAIAVISLLAGLAAGYLVAHNDNLNMFYEQYRPLIGAGLGAILLLVMGLLLKLNRLFVYGALTVLVIGCGYLLNLHPGITITFLAFLILLAGGSMLYRFVKKYPLAEGEGLGDDE